MLSAVFKTSPSFEQIFYSPHKLLVIPSFRRSGSEVRVRVRVRVKVRVRVRVR